MKAVQTGDIAALMINPEFMKLLNKQPAYKLKFVILGLDPGIQKPVSHDHEAFLKKP